MYYHVNGELVPDGEATVSVRDRGFAYGDAAFETLRAYGGDLFGWAAHADRLRETCSVLGLEHGLSDADLRARVAETLSANDLRDAYVRLSVTRGVQPGTLTPDPDVTPTVVVVVASLPRGGTEGTPVWEEAARARVVETRRVPDDAIPARAKTHNYLNGVLARLELRGTDAHEAVLRDGTGALAEGATSNVFFVRDGALHTPSLAGPVLPGVTRAVVSDLADEAGIPVETGRYDSRELREAEEGFLTNTTWEVRPLAALDGTPVGGGPVTRELAARFDALVERRHYQ